MTETVNLKFDGGLASTGQLHFYEFGRSQYALARFIATIEHFRRTGDIAERINSRTYVELTVAAPQKGSFIQDILIEAAKDGAVDLLKISFGAALAYIWHILAPRREKTDKALVEVAELQLAIEVQRTEQARELTKQLKLAKKISDGQRATASEAIELLKWANTVPADIAQTLEVSGNQRNEMIIELESERERELEFESAEGELAKLTEEDVNKLASRLRPMVGEIALPLKRSANTMTIGAPATEHSRLAYITPEIAALIQARTSEEEVIQIEGRIKSYDRDAGVGKVQSEQLPRILNFIVPAKERRNLRDLVLAAMARDVVTLEVRRVVDESGNPTSLMLSDILLPDQIESE